MMKEYKVNMTKKFIDLASKPIRNKNHIINLLLEAIPLINNGELIERPMNNYIVLRIDKMKRLFFVIENKIFSFNFPFNIERKSESDNPVIYDSLTELELNGLNFAVLKVAFEEIFNDKENQGILDIESELLQILSNFDNKPNKDQIWQIIKKLLIFESGYLRFDYDEENQNGKLHPLNHLDINYSSESTYKIGMSKIIDCGTFIDILDINTDSHYISK